MKLRARLGGAPMLQPLRHRDFALLVGGSVVSLLGDGFFFLALTWLVYSISNVPTALAVTGAAFSLPNVIFVLVGGALSDRMDRRRLMIGADLLRAAAIGGMAALSISGAVEIWQLVVLIAFVGVGNAFFNPASSAIVPDLVPDEQLPAANALAGLYRPLLARLIGPAVGGFVIAAFGPGPALAVDAASFLVSAAAVLAIRTRPARRPVTTAHPVRQTIAEVREGFRYARSVPWIWATLIAAMISLLVFLGPMEVLVPYLVKNRLGLGADAMGAVFAVGGVGSIVTSVLVGNLGMPRRRVTVMYAAFALGIALLAGFGLMTELWHALALTFVLMGVFELGQVIWTTMLQQLVPRDLLGRVSSLDWLISTGLVPISFALTGPVADTIGPETTIIVAGLAGAALFFALLFVPGVRDPERTANGLNPAEAATS
jgi:MFS family permease